MFKITDGRGFQMTFANGWTVSVQFGPGNYCDNRNLLSRVGESFTRMNRDAGEQGCSNAEIAAWNKAGVWYKFEHDTVEGYVAADKVAAFIQMIANK
jgi:hypothetical protein